MAKRESDHAAFVTSLNENDVLMGRGTPCSEYEGNLRFRQLVVDHRAEYMQSKRRHEKHQIAQEIVEEVHRRGGRFLQRIVTSQEAERLKVPPRTQAWKVIQETPQLHVKVKQLMRDVGTETQQKRKLRREERRKWKNQAKVQMPPPTQFSTQPQSAPEMFGSVNEDPSRHATDSKPSAVQENNLTLHGLVPSPGSHVSLPAVQQQAVFPGAAAGQQSHHHTMTAQVLDILLQQRQPPGTTNNMQQTINAASAAYQTNGLAAAAAPPQPGNLPLLPLAPPVPPNGDANLLHNLRILQDLELLRRAFNQNNP